MKKTLLLLTTLMLSQVLLFAQSKWISIDGTKAPENQVKLISSSDTEISVHVTVNAYQLKEVRTEHGIKTVVRTPEGTKLLEAGAPDLPKFARSFIVPDNSQMDLTVEAIDFVEYQGIDIAPSKGDFTRDIDPLSVPYTYGKVYQQDAFYPSNIASLREPYIIRDYRGQAVVFTPFQYNPVSKVLRIYTEFTLKLTPTNGEVVNPLIRSGNKYAEEFAHIYKKQFMNYNPAKYTPIDEAGEMLIICHPMFIEAMAPFVAWKIQRGMPTTLENSANYSNATAIKNYISTFYATNNLKYILLVGDANLVPTMSASAGDSDNSYGYLAGSDSYAEVFVGRFSCETEDHCITMVERSVEYELSPQASDFYGRTMGIASSQGPGDDNEYDYEHIRNMHTDQMAFTYTNKTEFFDGSQGGLDASGNPTASAIATELNTNGAGVILYTGHGSNTSFSTSGFSNTNINSLTNSNMLPFVWAVACVNGNFVSNTCFAEAWTRATHNNEPTGAVATLMSTINQSWDPPMCGQDEMVDILTESYTNNIQRTFGGISQNGISQMNDEYGTQGASMAQTWNLFGDPSLLVRTATPQAQTVSHLPTTFIGTSQFTVNCNLNGATVALTQGSTILASEKVVAGSALLSFPALSSVGILTVTVTGFNMITYVGTVEVVPNNGPYVTLTGSTVQDPTGNNNNLPDFGEDISLDITLTNVGNQMANNVSGTLSTTHPAITITNATATFGSIDSSSTAALASAFALSIEDSILDQDPVIFTLSLADNSTNNWASTFNIILNAPVLEMEYVNLSDAGANVNGRLDPGETAALNLNAFNNGNALSPNAVVHVSSTSPYITVVDTSVTVGQLDNVNAVAFAANIMVDASTPIGTVVDFNFEIVADDYSTSIQTQEKVGLIVEDWETNSFSSFNWVNDNVFPWTINSTGPYEGQFMAKSGSISNSQTSELQLTIETTVADSLSFFKKVSCEPAGWYGVYDYLEFFIDGASQGQWAGEIDWSKEQFWLPAGSHTLKWVYAKDNYMSEGEDCAWIDFIILPPLNINYQPMFTNTLSDTIGIEYGQNFSIDIEAFDLNSGDNLSMGGSILPSWLTVIDNGNWTGTLSGNADFAQVGFHNIELWVSDGIADTVYKEIVVKVIDLVGNPEIAEQESRFSIAPNPASDVLFLSVQLDENLEADVLIYNMLGKEIMMPLAKEMMNPGNSRYELRLDGLESGIYFISVQGANTSWQEKIVITK